MVQDSERVPSQTQAESEAPRMTRLHIPVEKLYTPKEISKKLGIGYPVVLKLIKEGKLKHYEITEKKRRISDRHLMDFLKECEK